MRTRSSLAIVAVAGSLLAAGCGGGTVQAVPAAARCIGRVDPSSNANGVLWAPGRGKPAVYAVAGTNVVSPTGLSRVPTGTAGVGFWACRPYSLLYVDRTKQLRMTGPHGPTTIGVDGLVAPNGRFLTYRGATIRYTNGEKLVVRGPKGWEITAVAVNPKNPDVALVNTVDPTTMTGEQCRFDAVGATYLVGRSKTRDLLDYNPCMTHPSVGWSPDGKHMSYILGLRKDLYIADAIGRSPVRVASGVAGYLWSPDGSRIAYAAYGSRNPRVMLLDVATGAIHALANGTLGAWSPDGKELAVFSGSSLMAVPAAGGRPQKLASLS